MNEHRSSILITGGTKGIGRSVAERLAREGYSLWLTYSQDQAAAEDTRLSCLAVGASEVCLLQANSSDMASVEVIRQALDDRDASLSGLILNAGITCRDRFEEMQYADWAKVFVANVHNPVFLVQALLPRIEQGGMVLFTGSMMAICPHSMSLAYGVSKAAVHSLVSNLVKHLEPYGIRVAGVAPGFVDTDWQKTKPTEIRQNIERKVALHRFADPQEIAEAYLFLLRNGYVNGEILQISGGYAFA